VLAATAVPAWVGVAVFSELPLAGGQRLHEHVADSVHGNLLGGVTG
jgi:hypothetical protein